MGSRCYSINIINKNTLKKPTMLLVVDQNRQTAEYAYPGQRYCSVQENKTIPTNLCSLPKDCSFSRFSSLSVFCTHLFHIMVWLEDILPHEWWASWLDPKKSYTKEEFQAVQARTRVPLALEEIPVIDQVALAIEANQVK